MEESTKAGYTSVAGYEAEAQAFAKLGVTSESEALRSIFFGQQACKKNPYEVPLVKMSKRHVKHVPNRYKANETKAKHVAVLGAGLMGAGVVEVSIPNGYTVSLLDASEGGLARGLNQIEKNLSGKVCIWFKKCFIG